MAYHTKERRLYAIDEAAFGEDRAPRMWEFTDSFGVRGLLAGRPSWHPMIKYERRPDAPAQPSDRWLDAPEWARFLLTDGEVSHWLKNDPRKDAPAPQPGSTGIGISGHELQERPLEAWFDLRRREKTSVSLTPAQKAGFQLGDEGIVIGDLNGFRDGQRVTLYEDDGSLAPGWRGDNETFLDIWGPGVTGAYLLLGTEVRKPRKEDEAPDPQSDGLLTGAALHRAIADAIDASEGPEAFEVWAPMTERWTTRSTFKGLVGADSRGVEIRRKPKTCHLIDANGVRHEWPAPMMKEPAREAPVWVVFDRNKPHKPWYWLPNVSPVLVDMLKSGCCHATREARDAHEAALIATNFGGRSQ